MTPDEIAAQKAEIEKQAKAIYQAKIARDKEIDALVDTVSKRDKKDFTLLAAEYKAEDRSYQDFAVAVATSDKFKIVTAIGAGIENVTEPLDQIKGTPGFDLVCSEHFRSTHDAWKRNGRHNFNLTINVPSQFRNATQTSSGLTSIEYKPGIAMLGVRPLRIKQIIPGGVTESTTIRSRVENAFTDDATSVAETGTLANVAVSYEEVDNPVKDLGGYIEMSENLMADYLAIGSFINMRLPYKVERVTDYQLINGAGAGSDLVGILSRAGVQTQAKAGDSQADAIFKAITFVRTVPNGVQANAGGGYDPDYIIVHPYDWETLRLAKDANGQYYAGGPFTGAYGNGAAYPNVSVLWGLPCVQTTAIPQGTALVGAFQECAQYFQRQGLTIEMTNSNGTNFIQRIITLRAAERLALTVDLPNGFCQVTGL